MAAVPILSTHPDSILLHYSLFQTLPVASNGMSCSLHSVILNLVQKLEKYRSVNNWFDSLCDWRRRKLNVKCAYFQTFYSDPGEREAEFADQYEKMKATVDGVVLLYQFLKQLKAILHSKQKLATVFQQYMNFTMNELQEEELMNSQSQDGTDEELQKLLYEVQQEIPGPERKRMLT